MTPTEILSELNKSVTQLNNILLGDEKANVNVNGVLKPSVTKHICDALSKYFGAIGVSTAIPFISIDSMNESSAANGSFGVVYGSNTQSENGYYQKSGGVWSKTPWDPAKISLEESSKYTDIKVLEINDAMGAMAANGLKRIYSESSSPDLYSFVDSEGNIILRVGVDGSFHLAGLADSVQGELTKTNDRITDTVDGVLSELAESVNVISNDEDLHTFTDSEGEVVARITSGGLLYVAGLSESIQDSIGEIGSKMTQLNAIVSHAPTAEGSLVSLTDSEGEAVLNITDTGSLQIVGVEGGVAEEFAKVRDEMARGSVNPKPTDVAESRTYKDTFTQKTQTLLNSLLYAQTGGIAPAPLHYLPQNYTISKTWVNGINQFGHANSTRLEISSPYRDDDGVVHPHILEFYNGFRGYRYIICITPYYLTNEAEENPCIYGSNDLINFDLLDGFDQPLDVRPTPEFSNGHNSDNVLAYDPRTGELICIWRQTLRNPNNDGVRVDALWVRKTKDGYTWSNKERIFKATDHALAGGAGSPAIVYNIADGYWYMYVTTLSLTTDALRLFRAKHLKEDKWEYVSTLTLPFKPWHQDMKIVGGKVCMLVYCYPPDNMIYFGVSDNFTDFQWTQNLLLENNAYKATFVPEFNELDQMALKILYSTDATPAEPSEKWRMYMHQTNFVNVNLELIV